MANFLPTEDLKIPLIVDILFVLCTQKYSTRHVLATDLNYNYLFRIIIINVVSPKNILTKIAWYKRIITLIIYCYIYLISNTVVLSSILTV